MALKSFKTNTLNGVSDINGLVLVNSTSFSAVSTQSFDNVFTSTYLSYKIIGQVTASTTGLLSFRMRASGTDNSSTDYAYSQYGAGSANQSSQSVAIFSATTSNRLCTFDATMQQPELNDETFYQCLSSNEIGTDNFLGYGWNGGVDISTRYDGFTLIPSGGGTISGTVKIYGLKD